MENTAKYLIHADITADGVVERSDVVGAVFGQTEGLLGDDLDLRDLQQSSRLGRIDVDVESQHGQSFGEITIASSLDKVETAVLAAALETITRVGPCRASVRISNIEDVRAAKRREVVERAKELLSTAFDDSVMSTEELLAEVQQSVRIEDITEYEGLPAGPRVADSDAIVVVEGRADVLTLLRYGVKNAIAVEGTSVPDTVVELTADRTVTAFLDGDRGGDLILKELAQVGDVDYVAFAPADRSVEDLDRAEVMSALREKVPYDTIADASDPREEVALTDGSTGTRQESENAPVDGPAGPETANDADTSDRDEPSGGDPGESIADEGATDSDEDDTPDTDSTGRTETDSADAGDDDIARPTTLRGHVGEVIEGESGQVRLLDSDFETIEEAPVENAFDAIESATTVPETVVLDGEVTQRILDVAAQRGVGGVVARSTGQFTKRPTSVRIRTADQISPEGAS